MTSRTLRNSLDSMGLEAFFNENYTKYAAPGKTAYQTLGEALDTMPSDSAVGRRFGRSPQAATIWRRHYEAIKTKGL